MIELKNVSKVYDNGSIALDHVSLHIGKGEFVFVVGASGAGVWVENVIRTATSAFVDGDSSVVAIKVNNKDADGVSLKLIALDTSTISAIAGAVSLAFAFSAEPDAD